MDTLHRTKSATETEALTHFWTVATRPQKLRLYADLYIMIIKDLWLARNYVIQCQMDTDIKNQKQDSHVGPTLFILMMTA